MSLSRINSLDRKEERIVGCGIVFVVTTCCRCRSFSFVVIVAACVVARCGYGCRFRSLSFSPSPVVVVFARGGQEDEEARSETIRSPCCIHVASCCLGGGCLLLPCCGWFRCWVKTISLVAVCPCRCPPMPYPSMSNLPLSSLPAIFVYSIIIRLQS